MRKRSSTQKRDRFEGDTSKSKRSLAPELDIPYPILEALQICWVPFPYDRDMKDLFLRISDVRDHSPRRILMELLNQRIAENMDSLKEEAEKSDRLRIDDLSVEDLEKSSESLKRKLDEMMRILEKKKSSE
jgi:hypothetical protein